MNKGKFIVFEGGEGSGKSTVKKQIAELLIAAGFQVLSLHEPGATALGERIRLLIRGDKPTTDLTELFLFQAARAELMPLITGALEKGKVVLVDRFTPSTVAYQGYGKGLDLDLIEKTNRLATDSLEPDLVLLLDIPPEIGLERAGKRGHLDRFEAEDLAFHQRVRDGYLTQVRKNEKSGKWVVIDANRPLEVVEAEVWEQITKRLPKLGKRK